MQAGRRYWPNTITTPSAVARRLEIAERTQTTADYRFGLRGCGLRGCGFNGQEKSEELGRGMQNFGARHYDAKTGRFWSVDPESTKYPMLSSYLFANNSPISGVDINSLEYYYAADGTFLGKIGTSTAVRLVAEKDIATVQKYIASADYHCKQQDQRAATRTRFDHSVSFDDILNDWGYNAALSSANKLSKDLGVKQEQLVEKGALIYGESSAYKYSADNDNLKYEMFALAYVYERNQEAYGGTNAQANLFRNTSTEDRNGTKMQIAIAAMINYHIGGFDYSYCAIAWDGSEQTYYKDSDKCFSDGKNEIHKNTIGWRISDNHYKQWKANVGKGFVAPQVSYTPNNKQSNASRFRYWIPNSIQYESVAVYGGTIFWKKANERKP